LEKIIRKKTQIIINKKKGKRRLGKNHASAKLLDQIELKRT